MSGAEVPLVSVVVPAFKRAAQLPRLLDSVLNSEATDFEVIVVDDASPDETAAIAAARAAVDPRVRVLRHDTNGGVHAARNTGMHAARGRWVAFIDADDYFLPTAWPQIRSALDRLVADAEHRSEIVFFAYRADTGEPTGLKVDGAVTCLDVFTGAAFRTEKTCLFVVSRDLITRSGARWYYTNLDSLFWRDLAYHARPQGALSFTDPVGIYDTGTEGSLKKLRTDPAHVRRHAPAKLHAVLDFIARTEPFLRAQPRAAEVVAGFYLLTHLKNAPRSTWRARAVFRTILVLPVSPRLRIKLLAVWALPLPQGFWARLSSSRTVV
jgi:glycosyltransferase involved in cell wall biosynthesis